MTDSDEMAATVALCLRGVPELLRAVECMLEAHEHAYRGEPDEPDELGDALEVVAGRILTGLFGTCNWPSSEVPWRADEAAAAVTALTARYRDH